MALKATIFKAELSISDMDRQYYAEHSLVLARHPSETDERLIVRLLAFAMYAAERLEFSDGLSAPDEPCLWLKSFSGEIDLWIDVGLPDERRIRKACSRANSVVVLSYGGRRAELWLEQFGRKLDRFENLTVVNLSADDTQNLQPLVSRSMALQCSIDGGQLWITGEGVSVEISPAMWKR